MKHKFTQDQARHMTVSEYRYYAELGLIDGVPCMSQMKGTSYVEGRQVNSDFLLQLRDERP